MTESNEPFNEHFQHHAPAEVASYLEKSGVGNIYATHGDLWNAKSEVKILGTLQLILRELKKNDKPRNQASSSSHREWLYHHQKQDMKLIAELEASARRVRKLIGKTKRTKWDVTGNIPSMASMGYMFSLGWERHDEYRKVMTDRLKRLRSVKSKSDIGNLK